MEEKEMEGLSKKALIECAKICAGSGNCADCDFCAEDECDRALLKALASALEEVPEGIEWIDTKMATPAVDDEYLVMIAGMNKPTVLLYDFEEDSFYAENCDLEPEWYPVTHWAARLVPKLVLVCTGCAPLNPFIGFVG